MSNLERDSVQPFKIPFTLTTNDKLNGICSSLEEAQPDWQKIQEMYQQRKTHDHIRPYGYFAEIHLENVLREVAREDRGVIVDPIQDQARTQHYSFKRKDKQIEVYSGNKVCGEYDSVVYVDELPVVFESKVLKGTGKSNKHAISAVSKNNIRRRLRPLHEYFDTDRFGYVVATNPEALPKGEPGEQFEAAGGIIVPFAATYEEFRNATLLDKFEIGG